MSAAGSTGWAYRFTESCWMSTARTRWRTPPPPSADQLAVNGRDLAAYAQGPALGKLLHRLLDAVIDGDCPNDHDALIALAVRLASQLSG